MIRDAIIFTAVITADRITKMIVPHFMDLHQSIPVIPNLFNFTYVMNTGGAFGILASWDSPMRRGFFIIASLAAIVLLWFLYGRPLQAPPGCSGSLSYPSAGAPSATCTTEPYPGE